MSLLTPQWPDGFTDEAAEIAEADALKAFKDLSYDINHDGPLFRMLANQRENARAAVRGLIFADPTNTTNIMRLQNEVQRYFDLVEFARTTIEGGMAAEGIDPAVARGVIADITTPED